LLLPEAQLQAQPCIHAGHLQQLLLLVLVLLLLLDGLLNRQYT
jgi:hypothetical protein